MPDRSCKLLLANVLTACLAATVMADEAATEQNTPSAAAPEAAETSLRLTLPPVIPAVSGVEAAIWFDNIVLTEHPEALRFDVDCPVGKVGERGWQAVPSTEDVGDHKLVVKVFNGEGEQVDSGEATLRVAPPIPATDRPLRLLLIGDSLTHATIWPNELARLLTEAGTPWTMLGTHRPASAAAGVAHEGYGGWTWERFLSHFEPQPDGTPRKRSSPFVFAGVDGRPMLDVPRYIREQCDGTPPDVVVFLLGINDCFSANPDDAKAIKDRIDAVLGNAEMLLEAFRLAAPRADLAVCLTPPPNARESGFEANYQGKYHRWGWKRIQHRLVEGQLELYSRRMNESRRTDERIFIVPIELGVDPVDGYPVDNGVHPNAAGYRQIAASVYAWLCAEAATKRADRLRRGKF